MSETSAISKDENSQTSVPSVWRSVFSEIIEAFIEGDFRLDRRLEGVRPISEEDAKRIERNINRYGATLTRLPEDAWGTSACQWMKGYWDVLVDIYTVEEGASDLVLSVRVYEEGKKYVFDVRSVYVP